MIPETKIAIANTRILIQEYILFKCRTILLNVTDV